MTAIYYDILTSKNPKGECEIVLRLNITRENKLRVRSGVWVDPQVWNKKRKTINLPTTPGREREYLLAKKNQLLDLSEQIDEAIALYGNRDNITRQWVEELIRRSRRKKRVQNDVVPPQKSLIEVLEEYMKNTKLSASRIDHLQVFVRMLMRFEMYQKAIGKKDCRLYLDTLTRDKVEAIEDFIGREHEIFEKYPRIYEKIPARARKAPKTGGVKRYPSQYKSNKPKGMPSVRGLNYIADVMARFRTFIKWAIDKELTTNNPFKDYPIAEPVYGRPIYINIDERNRLYRTDMSDDWQLETQRDIFILQCYLGCRIGDYYEMTYDDIIDGAIEYIANKTNTKNPVTIRVPLAETAWEIIERYRDSSRKSIMPFLSEYRYNDYIKEAFRRAGLTRTVTIINQQTHKNEHKPLCDIASSHMARRTFIGNIYKQVKDQNLVAALSGHKEGSRAFARYRDIDDDLRKDMVKLLG